MGCVYVCGGIGVDCVCSNVVGLHMYDFMVAQWGFLCAVMVMWLVVCEVLR
jgi:hypothetical protein